MGGKGTGEPTGEARGIPPFSCSDVVRGATQVHLAAQVGGVLTRCRGDAGGRAGLGRAMGEGTGAQVPGTRRRRIRVRGVLRRLLPTGRSELRAGCQAMRGPRPPSLRRGTRRGRAPLRRRGLGAPERPSTSRHRLPRGNACERSLPAHFPRPRTGLRSAPKSCEISIRRGSQPSSRASLEAGWKRRPRRRRSLPPLLSLESDSLGQYRLRFPSIGAPTRRPTCRSCEGLFQGRHSGSTGADEVLLHEPAPGTACRSCRPTGPVGHLGWGRGQGTNPLLPTVFTGDRAPTQ